MDDTSVTFTNEVQVTKWNIAKVILLSGYIVSVLTAVMIVFTALYMMVFHPELKMPDALTQWVGIVIGFIFGTMGNMVKEFVSNND